MDRDTPDETLDRVHQGKERSGQKLLRLSDPGTCMEPKHSYSSWFKDPEEVAPRACHLENGGSSSMAKKKIVHARRRRLLSVTDPGGLSTKTKGIAARQPSLHICYQATLPSHSCTGQQKTTLTPSCHNMGALWSSLPKGTILQRKVL